MASSSFDLAVNISAVGAQNAFNEIEKVREALGDVRTASEQLNKSLGGEKKTNLAYKIVVDDSGVAEVSWYIDRTPSFHQRPSTRPRPSPYGYIYPEDEFMDEYMNLIHRNLVPRNLNQEFDSAAVKKYHIAPSISVTETSEELEKCEDCSICYETTKLSNTVTINCGHKFCGSCVKRTLEMHTNIYNSPSCALCRAPMRNFVAKNPDIYNLVVEHCIL